jgi:hypothetical protein
MNNDPTYSSVFWKDATAELPDDDMSVLVALDDGEVWTGFHDYGVWRYVSADAIDGTVTHWAEFPEPPANVKDVATDPAPVKPDQI